LLETHDVSTPPLTTPPHRKNFATAFGAVMGASREPRLPPSPREAYAFAVAAERARAPLTGFGHRIYWMTGSRVGCRDLLAGPDSMLVAGRHTNCDLVLDADARLSLRHVLLRSSTLDDGALVLAVTDLKTDLGFALPNGALERSITAAGPVVITMGAYALVAFPSGHEADAELPLARVELAASLGGAPAAGAHPYRAAAPIAARPTIITLMPNVLDLGERWSPMGAANMNDDYDLVVRSPRGRAALTLSSAELDAGVLVGRAPKCVDAGLARILTSGVSRVHVLLMRSARGQVLAYDMASTQGTYDAWDHAVRVVPMLDEGTHLRLGTEGITLSWRRR
jgi:hypothetical protein